MGDKAGLIFLRNCVGQGRVPDGGDLKLILRDFAELQTEHASLTEKVERLVTGGKKFSASIHYDNSPDDGYATVDPQDWAEFAALLESEQDDPTAPDPAD